MSHLSQDEESECTSYSEIEELFKERLDLGEKICEDEGASVITFSGRVKEEYSRLEAKVKKNLEKYEIMQRHFIERTEELIKQLIGIADDVDKFHRAAIIANITGSSIGIAGGIATIVGLFLAPVTFGASLIVTGVGIGVATAGGVTGAAASIADRVNIKIKCNIVEEIIKEINIAKENMQAVLKKTDSLIKEMASLLGLKKDFFRAGAKGVFAASQVARLVQLARLSATAARGAQIVARGAQAAAAVSGVFAALFIAVDIGFIVKGAKDLKEGAKCEEAAKIREIAEQLKEDCEQLANYKID
uniref:Apolipoprotein L3 n=1 Tax=Leptobrachium leishanense TaxID=445787 RepID=A0A8C5QFB4_9ANUR